MEAISNRENDSTPGRRSIRELRIAKGLTQAQLATAIGSDPASMSKLEGGHRKPSGLTLQRIAQALGVDANLIDLGDAVA